MRLDLAEYLGERHRFIGVFERYGHKTSFKGKSEITVLIKDLRIKASGELVTDHLWFTCGKRFKELPGMHEGDVLEFNARVTTYKKGYEKDELDYKLSFPTQLKVTPKVDEASKPTPEIQSSLFDFFSESEKPEIKAKKMVSFRIKRIYFDLIVSGDKAVELRAQTKHWLKVLFHKNPPEIAVFVCGKDVHRREILNIKKDQDPEKLLGRKLSKQGLKDITTKTCIAVWLGAVID